MRFKLILIALHLVVLQSHLTAVHSRATERELQTETNQKESVEPDRVESELRAESSSFDLLDTETEDGNEVVLGSDAIAQKPSLLTQVSSGIRNAILPIKSYIGIVNRYQKWYRRYRDLATGNERRVLDVLRLEYARIDERLAAECSSQDLDIAKDDRSEDDDSRVDNSQVHKMEEDCQTVDFVVKVLWELIGTLEKRLEELESRKRSGVEIETGEEQDPQVRKEEDARVQAAMDRIKRIAMRAAKGVAKNEMMTIAKIAAFDALACYVDSQQPARFGGDVLVFLKPIIHMLGSSTTPIAMSYMRNIQFRAALAIINRVDPFFFFKSNNRKEE